MTMLLAHHIELHHVPVLAGMFAAGCWIGWEGVSKSDRSPPQPAFAGGFFADAHCSHRTLALGRHRAVRAADRMKKTRTRILRMDGKLIYLAQKRAHLFVCAKGCCCGRTDRGHAAVPIDFYKQQYKQRKLRQAMQLSMNGCLGPCAMANAVLLVFDGRPIWFQSINHEPQIVAIFDYVEQMLAADSYLPPPAELAEYVFDYYLWSNSLSSPQANCPRRCRSPSSRASCC